MGSKILNKQGPPAGTAMPKMTVGAKGPQAKGTPQVAKPENMSSPKLKTYGVPKKPG